MKRNAKMALLDACLLVATWGAMTIRFLPLHAQVITAVLHVMAACIVVIVSWRVYRAYSTKRVRARRAVVEGFLLGALVVSAAQIISFAYLYACGQPMPLIDSLRLISAQALYSGAAGAILGLALWAINRVAIRRLAF